MKLFKRILNWQNIENRDNDTLLSIMKGAKIIFDQNVWVHRQFGIRYTVFFPQLNKEKLQLKLIWWNSLAYTNNDRFLNFFSKFHSHVGWRFKWLFLRKLSSFTLSSPHRKMAIETYPLFLVLNLIWFNFDVLFHLSLNQKWILAIQSTK